MYVSSMHVYMYTYMHTYIHTYLHKYVHIYIYIYIHVRVYLHIHGNIRMTMFCVFLHILNTCKGLAFLAWNRISPAEYGAVLALATGRCMANLRLLCILSTEKA